MKSGRLNLLFLTVFILILAVVGFFLVRHLGRTDPRFAKKVNAPVPVVTARAEVTALSGIIGASGYLQPISEITLRSDVPALVLKVTVDVGDRVKKGQEVIRLKGDVFAAELATATKLIHKRQADLDYAALLYKQAEIEYEKKLISKVELEEARAKLHDAEYFLAKAKETFSEAQNSVDNAVITSPVDGIALERNINPGEMIKKNADLMRIGNMEKIAMNIAVPEESFHDLSIGQSADIVFDAFPGRIINGIVMRIGPAADTEKKIVPVLLSMNNEEMRLQPGMSGFARIKNDRMSLAVPSIAVIKPSAAGDATVFVFNEDSSTVHLRQVKTGISSGGLTEILDGIREHELIVTVGQINLRDGDKVLHSTIDGSPQDQKHM